MLGGRRPTISTTAEILKRKGLIDTPVEKSASLTSLAYEGRLRCYLIIKDHLDNYAEFDPHSLRSRVAQPLHNLGAPSFASSAKGGCEERSTSPCLLPTPSKHAKGESSCENSPLAIRSSKIWCFR